MGRTALHHSALLLLLIFVIHLFELHDLNGIGRDRQATPNGQRWHGLAALSSRTTLRAARYSYGQLHRHN